MAVAVAEAPAAAGPGREIAALEAKLRDLADELAAIPGRVAECLVEGGDKGYRRAKDRQSSIPREVYSVQVKLLRLRVRERQAQHAAVVAEIPGLGEEAERTFAAWREATEAKDDAAYALSGAQHRRRDLQGEITNRERELASLLSAAGKVGN